MQKKHDDLYGDPQQQIADFRFDEQVAGVFTDMIQRSVPGYGTVISNIGVLAGHYAQPGTQCYDLGCSLGAATLAMRKRIPHPDCKIIAIDNSRAMLERCRQYIDADNSPIPVETHCEDICDISIQHASVVVLNYTYQFLPREKRQRLLQTIHQGLVPGGILILSEKICFPEQSLQQQFTTLHHEYKKANGYSELEISQKRTALENVLLPDTETTHQQSLKQAGFKQVQRWFQCLNFISLLAIK